jgi:hypothetical protein
MGLVGCCCRSLLHGIPPIGVLEETNVRALKTSLQETEVIGQMPSMKKWAQERARCIN